MPPRGELWAHPTLLVPGAKPTHFAGCTSNHFRISDSPAVPQAYLKKQEVTCGSSKSAFCGKMCNKAITHWIMYSDGSVTPHPPPIDACGFKLGALRQCKPWVWMHTDVGDAPLLRIGLIMYSARRDCLSVSPIFHILASHFDTRASLLPLADALLPTRTLCPTPSLTTTASTPSIRKIW
jgi:hypothetical protein